jgi:hypothetical protein
MSANRGRPEVSEARSKRRFLTRRRHLPRMLLADFDRPLGQQVFDLRFEQSGTVIPVPVYFPRSQAQFSACSRRTKRELHCEHRLIDMNNSCNLTAGVWMHCTFPSLSDMRATWTPKSMSIGSSRFPPMTPKNAHAPCSSPLTILPGVHPIGQTTPEIRWFSRRHHRLTTKR